MNKPHKHADVIKAFADGKQIQFRYYNNQEWLDWDRSYCPTFSDYYEYRVKPMPYHLYGVLCADNGTPDWSIYRTEIDNIKATFDQHTGKLISVEVLK